MTAAFMVSTVGVLVHKSRSLLGPKSFGTRATAGAVAAAQTRSERGAAPAPCRVGGQGEGGRQPPCAVHSDGQQFRGSRRLPGSRGTGEREQCERGNSAWRR